MRSKSHEHHDACEQDGGIGRAVVPPGRRGRSVRAMTSAALGAAGVGRDRRTVAHGGPLSRTGTGSVRANGTAVGRQPPSVSGASDRKKTGTE